MKPKFLLRKAYFLQRFRTKLGDIAHFLYEKGFSADNIARILQPAADATQKFLEGEHVDVNEEFKRIAERIVYFGNKEGINLAGMERIPHINNAYLVRLISGLSKEKISPVNEEKIPKITPQLQQNIQEKIKLLEEEKAKAREAEKEFRAKKREEALKRRKQDMLSGPSVKMVRQRLFKDK